MNIKPPLHDSFTNAQLLAVRPNRVPSSFALTCSQAGNLSRMSEAKTRPGGIGGFFQAHCGPISTIECLVLRPHSCLSKYFPI